MKESDYKKELSEEEEKKYQEAIDLIELGKRKKASQKLDQFLSEHPNFVPALNKKAVLYIYNKNFNEAQSLLNQVLKQDSNYAPAITNLGSIEKEMGNLDKAKKFYKKAIKINENYGAAYNNLGVIYREEGNYSKSVKYLKKARKKGGLSYDLSKNKPIYKNPGCLFMIFLILALIIILYLIII